MKFETYLLFCYRHFCTMLHLQIAFSYVTLMFVFDETNLPQVVCVKVMGWIVRMVLLTVKFLQTEPSECIY